MSVEISVNDQKVFFDSMTEFNLVIGELALSLASKDPLLLTPLNLLYKSFLVMPSLSAGVKLNVISRSMGTDIYSGNEEEMRLLLQCSPWKLLKSENQYFIVRTIFNPPQIFWTACVSPTFDSITIQYNVGPPGKDSSVEDLMDSILMLLGRLLMMHRLAGQGLGLLLHTAALHLGGRIWLFSGCSGAGKSTFSRLWLDHTDAHVVNDDRMIVRQNAKELGFTAYGTPWPSDLGIALNETAPLAGICFLHKSAQTEIRPITPQQALPQLLPLASIPWYEQDLVPPALDFCDRLLAGVPLYELHFRPDQSAVEAVLQLAG